MCGTQGDKALHVHYTCWAHACIQVMCREIWEYMMHAMTDACNGWMHAQAWGTETQMQELTKGLCMLDCCSAALDDPVPVAPDSWPFLDLQKIHARKLLLSQYRNAAQQTLPKPSNPYDGI